MTEPVGIYAALSAVMAEVGHVAKKDVNQHQHFNFRGIDAVVNAVGPALRKHGVIVAPNVENATYDTVQTSTGKPATACRLLVTYSFYASDGSSVDVRVAAEAWDSGDKSAPKAMSVAFRTALLQALALPTDEADPDSQTYERDNRPATRSRAVPADDPWYDQPAPDPTPMTEKRRKQLFATFSRKGVTEDRQLAGANLILGTAYTSRSEFNEGDAQRLLKELAKRVDVAAPAKEESAS